MDIGLDELEDSWPMMIDDLAEFNNGRENSVQSVTSVVSTDLSAINQSRSQLYVPGSTSAETVASNNLKSFHKEEENQYVPPGRANNISGE